jgi:Protein of unknown function (DUF3631)
MNIPNPHIRSIDERADRELATVQQLAPASQKVPAASTDDSHAGAIPHAVQQAFERLTDDPGALFESEVLETIKVLRQSDPATYQRIRAKAKDGKAIVTELDRLTTASKDEREEGVMFPHVEPWPDPVDGDALIRDLCRTIQDHVIADKPTILAAALWCMHTWCMEALTVSPLAHITSPEKRCGKTVLLTAMSRLVYRPMPVSNISSAAIFRIMEAWQPTLLIDEADTFLKENDEARGIINSGLYRESAYVVRVEGESHIPTPFRTWGAKVVCGIGKLADTIEDRSIPLLMRRKVAGESVANIRHSEAELWDNLRRRVARWVADHCARIAIARPALALGLNDRARDCWEPLLAIADLAGEAWARAARSAAQKLHGIEEETSSIGVELLRDIRDVFERRQASRLASKLLLELLAQDEESPWAEWNRGRPMTERQLSQRLGAFNIKPKPLRIGGALARGYDVTDFADAFTRYLFGDNPDLSVTALQPRDGARFHGFSSVTGGEGVTDSNGPQTSPQSHCYGVTDKTDLSGNKEEYEDEREDFTL